MVTKETDKISHDEKLKRLRKMYKRYTCTDIFQEGLIMGMYNREDIIGYHTDDGEIWCVDCWSDKESNEDSIITKKGFEDKIFFCDNCGNQI